MLVLSTMMRHRREFVDTYEQLVSRRIRHKYRVSSHMLSGIDAVIALCEERKFPVVSFVESTFVFFGFDVCKKLFKLPFPPVNAFKSKNNIKAYERYTLIAESYIKSKMVQRAPEKTYALEMLHLPNNDFESILFCLSSGTISEDTLYKAVAVGKLKKADVDAAVNAIREE